jgi:uncharacterized membrane protein
MLKSILRSCLVLLALTGAAVASADAAEDPPDVRALLFYDSGKPQGRDLFAFYLPALTARYGTRLEVSGIDVAEHSGAQAYGAAAARWGLPPPPDGLPAAVVGDQALTGLLEIAQGLGDRFEELAQAPDAARWPDLPELESLIPAGIQDAAERVAREGVTPASDSAGSAGAGGRSMSDRIANGLAVVVLIGMVLALVHALVRLRRQDGGTGPTAAKVLIAVLLVGLGISAYTAYTALAHVSLACGPIGSCAEVQGSEYAKLFGIPMGVLGLNGYLLILVTWLIARQLSPKGGGWNWLPWGVALFGVLFSLRLTALEPFVIGATCLWCLGSAVSITIAFWLLSGFARTGR